MTVTIHYCHPHHHRRRRRRRRRHQSDRAMAGRRSLTLSMHSPETNDNVSAQGEN